jgi:membrane glycosyltransferase
MIVGLAIPLLHAGLTWGNLTLVDFSPTGYLREQDPDRFLAVFILTMTMLLSPKLFGYLATVSDPALRRGCGGALRTFLGMLLETLLAALMAPVTMYVQSRGVAEVLAGRDSGWETQRRDDGSLPLSALVRSYGGMTLAGVIAGVAAWLVSPPLAAWMSPVIAGLVLSMPIVAVTSARGPGQWLRRHRIFCTPEELAPPPVLVRAGELRAAAEARTEVRIPEI